MLVLLSLSDREYRFEKAADLILGNESQ
ncbi:uncharacterized protein METZ01_LOCUS292744 [marine metagenome]|uniref:Uncharacterized protein n=1 Tax=marine metagenome TaxID=408172 RepID=A0A382LTD9_9ZZZZ